MQSYLPKGESMPGTAFTEEYFPHTQISAKKTRKVRVAHEVLICQHVAASAQQLHWDFKPRGSCDTKELLGSVLVALWTTRLIIYPMSHRWDKMVSSEGANSKRKRQRQTTSSLAGRQLLPVIVEIPCGINIVLFRADARWIWHLESGRNADQTSAIDG